MPKSLWLFVFTAGVYALQTVPGPDAILMVLLASMWPVLTINAGFLLLAAEALTGRISAVWLLPVVLYFGGNLVLSAASHVELWRLNSAVEAYNAARTLAFDPARDALVVDVRNGLAPVPYSLIAGYDIPVAFRHDDEDKRNPSVAVGMGVDPLCNRLWKAQSAQQGNSRVLGYLEPNGKRSALVKGMCTYEQPRLPAGRTVTVVAGSRVDDDSFMLATGKQTITLSATTGEKIDLLYADARPLSWFPMPFGGCFRGPGDKEAHCTYGPLRVFSVPAIGSARSATELVANALDLMPAMASKRREKIRAGQPAM